MFKVFITILLVMISFSAHSLSGNEYLERCEDKHLSNKKGESPQQIIDRALNTGSCAGYVGGVINGVNFVGNMLRQQKAMNKNFICLPDGLQANELVGALIKYLKTNPTDMNLPVTLHIHKYFANSYPCPNPAEKKAKK